MRDCNLLLQGLSTAARLFSMIKPPIIEPERNFDLPSLAVRLRPYQQRAAEWMTQREVLFPFVYIFVQITLQPPVCVLHRSICFYCVFYNFVDTIFPHSSPAISNLRPFVRSLLDLAPKKKVRRLLRIESWCAWKSHQRLDMCDTYFNLDQVPIDKILLLECCFPLWLPRIRTLGQKLQWRIV